MSTERKQPQKAGKIRIAPQSRVSDAARAGLADGVRQIQHNAGGALLHDDPGFVHQLRVGLRRLRVFVQLFEAHLGEARAQRLTRELRWLFVALGSVRDRQLFASAYLSGRGASAERSARDIEREVEKQLRALRVQLRGARFARLLRVLHTSVSGLETHADEPSARRFLKRELKRRRKQAMGAYEAVLRRDMEGLHELRKTLKKLRYTADLCRGLFPKQRVKAYLTALRELQDALGAVVDTTVAETLLQESALSKEAQASLQETIESTRVDKLRALAPVFERFSAMEPFWRS